MVDTSAGPGGTASFSYEPRPSSSSSLCGLRGIGARMCELSGEKKKKSPTVPDELLPAVSSPASLSGGAEA
jgi:hypothetical protein